MWPPPSPSRPMRSILARAFALLAVSAALPAAAQQDDFARRAADLYRVQPSIAACRAGELLPAQRRRVLALVNDIRARHGLDPVAYDEAAEAEATQAALLIAANGRLSHAPTPDWRCFSAAAARGARSSLLYGGTRSPYLVFAGPDEIVIDWLTDTRNAVADGLGHRRWLLDPFLQRIAFGMVAGRAGGDEVSSGAALRFVPAASGTVARTQRDFVAWPVGDYPQRYYAAGAALSFSALMDRGRKFANRDVDYSHARIAVGERGGPGVAVTAVRYDSDGFGLPNHLQFRVPALRPGVVYEVSIRDVRLAGQGRDYRYWFRIAP
ncbi:CAP domain-containing protein [Xanthomonas sp. AmX2]|nr:CAP domain-containing protein [Xanthomonas sp.]